MALLSFTISLLIALSGGRAAGSELARGIRFEASLFVKVESQPNQRPAITPMAGLLITLHVSAHSLESSFDGDVVTRFDNLDPLKEGGRPPFWSDKACHQDRGYPRVNIKKIKGILEQDSGPHPIDSTVRVIGKPIPADEIYAASQPLDHETLNLIDKDYIKRAFYFKTRESLLSLEIHLTKTRC